MEDRILTEEKIDAFQKHLIRGEKSMITIEKYLHDVRMFKIFAEGNPIKKDLVLAYKQSLIEQYAVRSVNSKLASLGSLFSFLGWEDCRVKSLKLQQQIYASEKKELTKTEYLRLINASATNPRLCLIIETLCSTGIRVSELQYFTVEAVSAGTVTVSSKNKTRNILIPGKLRKLLLNYAKRRGITNGIIFRTRSGRPLNRSNIWAEMKRLCAAARVHAEKVFPHNLRKLFARTFYSIEKDIAKLADILGHSSINTTRIYIMTTYFEHRRKIERLGLVV